MKAINFFLPKNLFADHSCENISFFGLFSVSVFPFFKLLTFVEFFQFLVPFFRPVRITVNFVKILFHAANLSTYKLLLFFKKQSFFQQSFKQRISGREWFLSAFLQFWNASVSAWLECSFFLRKREVFTLEGITEGHFIWKKLFLLRGKIMLTRSCHNPNFHRQKS